MIKPLASPDPIALSTMRYHGLDALRAFAMLLGIALHGGMSYIGAYLTDGDLTGWPFDPVSSGFILILVLWIHAWRMQTFFLMAGFFAHMVIQRRGMRSFVKNRFRHVFIPFVLGMIVIVPLTIGVIVYGAWRTGTLDQLGQSANTDTSSTSSDGLSPLHLWFLCYLLGFYLIIWGMSAAASRLRRLSAAFLRYADRCMGWVMRSRWRVVWLSLPTMLLRALVTSEDVILLELNLPFFLYHGSFFLFGWLVFRQPLLFKPLSHRRIWGSYLLLGTLVVLPMTLILGSAVSEHHLVYSGIYSLQTWLMMFGFIGMFDAINTQARGWVRYLADAAYWVYLMHLPLVALLSIWLIDLRWAALSKFVIVCVVSCTILLMSYQWGVRYTFIGRLLNGPRSRGKLNPIACATSTQN